MALTERSKRSGEALFNGVVSVGTGTTEVRPANRKRTTITLVNDGANKIYVFKGSGAETGKGIPLLKEGGSIIIEDWLGIVTAAALTGATNLCVSEV